MQSIPPITELLKHLSSEALDYFFPGLSEKLYSLSSTSFGIEAHTEACQLDESIFKPQHETIRFRKVSSPLLVMEEEIDEVIGIDDVIEAIKDEVQEREREAKVQEFMKEMKELMDKYHLTFDQITAILEYQVNLSRLQITKSGKITLIDFDYQEVKMDVLSKTVFFFYLIHPEGVNFKDLIDYKDELTDIYASISGKGDMASIRASIDTLVDVTANNSLNEKVSRVKRAFRNVVDDRIAQFYYIDGKAGTAKSIKLDRSLVIWC